MPLCPCVNLSQATRESQHVHGLARPQYQVFASRNTEKSCGKVEGVHFCTFTRPRNQGSCIQAWPTPRCNRCFTVAMDTKAPRPHVKEKEHSCHNTRRAVGMRRLNENAKTPTQDASFQCYRARQRTNGSRRRGKARSFGGYFVLGVVFRVNIKENRECARKSLS